MTRPSRLPDTATKSNAARCWTSSHRPTPPACGHTGTPNLAASSSTATTSLTPPSRQASIWQTPIPPACRNCLNITRFWQCSPVATAIGATARAIAACPRTSSGLVGSSIQRTSVGADLELDVREAVGERLGDQRAQLRLVVAEPAGRCRVRGQAVGEQRPLALGPAFLALSQQCEGLGGGQ